MNRITYALALGAGLVLSLAGPSLHAAPIVQKLDTPTMSSAEFNSLFQPIPGVVPLKSARSARWMCKHLPGTIIPDAIIARLERAADPALEGRRICVELMQELAEIPGVAGAHVMAPANPEAIPEVLMEAANIRRNG